MTNIIAKFRLVKIEKNENAGKEIANLTFSGVYGTSEENKKFFEWTPYGTLQIGTVNNQVLQSVVAQGEYYVIITDKKPEGF